MKTLADSLYIACVIGTKDILDALKNKGSRNNLFIIVLMVMFFYWLSDIRPFDKKVSVVAYDESTSLLTMESVKLSNGTEYTFQKATSFEDMQQKMANQDLGLVIPTDFNQGLASDGTGTLEGYIFWVSRSKVGGLEARYSQAFSEILNQPVRVVIGDHILIPRATADGQQTNVTYLMVYFVFSTALLLIPHLMLEEKQTKTLDALLTSPASPGQIVFGKALAGLFYILIVGGLAMALFSLYIVNWFLAISAFLGYALLAVGLGLLVGSFIKSMKQLGPWMLVLMLVLMIPPLFYTAPNLKEGIRVVFTWMPSSALASLFRFACSTSYTVQQILPNLAIAL
ncbi:MAG TPA: ABC transporter permease, partial [Anaerolineales bacterium]|nr:ABC transporter permease [Anaerolineales bacterium]